MSDTPIRTDLPPDLHPGILGGALGRTLDQPDTIGIHTLSAGREALKVVYESLALLNDAEKSQQKVLSPSQKKYALAAGQDVRMVNGMPVLVAKEVEAEFAEAAKKAFSVVAPQVDRRMKELRGHAEVFEKRVAEALDQPSRKSQEGLALAQEVRNHVKQLPQGERFDFIRKAIQAGDKATVAAILHAQPFLSGLDQLGHDNMRRQAAEQFAPVDYAQHQATLKVLAKVEHAGSHLVQRYTSILSRPVSRSQDAVAKVKALASAGK